MSELVNLPPQKLPYNRKNAKWRKQMLDWADSKTFFNYSLVRKSVIHKKINYDLLNGKLHMSDLEVIVNPENIKSSSSTEPFFTATPIELEAGIACMLAAVLVITMLLFFNDILLPELSKTNTLNSLSPDFDNGRRKETPFFSSTLPDVQPV